ncbi:MAG: UxaA family hydrolase [Firmicutes bacterium]|jgi:altronate dehydratase small subunit|nr:UxaA family hydrolase [Bacillota bacterium]
MDRGNAIRLHPADNVATALADIQAGELAEVLDKTAACSSLPALDPIPFGHKLAVALIRRGEHILKYGESIGIATQDIRPGNHVHIHNLDSTRGRGDLGEGKRGI